MATHSVFLPGESQGRGSLVGCCLWGRTESDTTEATWQQQQQQHLIQLFSCSVYPSSTNLFHPHVYPILFIMGLN